MEYLEALKTLDYHNDLKKCWGKEFDVVEQALLKAQKQEKVLSIIFEKNVDILELRILIKHHNDRMALKLYNRQYKKEWQLTKEEFDTLKELLK